MHSTVTIKNVSWPHFSWATLYALYTQKDAKIEKKMSTDSMLIIYKY